MCSACIADKAPNTRYIRRPLEKGRLLLNHFLPPASRRRSRDGYTVRMCLTKIVFNFLQIPHYGLLQAFCRGKRQRKKLGIASCLSRTNPFEISRFPHSTYAAEEATNCYARGCFHDLGKTQLSCMYIT